MLETPGRSAKNMLRELFTYTFTMLWILFVCWLFFFLRIIIIYLMLVFCRCIIAQLSHIWSKCHAAFMILLALIYLPGWDALYFYFRLFGFFEASIVLYLNYVKSLCNLVLLQKFLAGKQIPAINFQTSIIFYYRDKIAFNKILL